MRRSELRSKTEDLLRETRQLKEQLRAFERSARKVMPPLRRRVSRSENEAMETPRANIVGTLEVLLNQDFPDVVRQLDELEGYLRAESVAPT